MLLQKCFQPLCRDFTGRRRKKLSIGKENLNHKRLQSRFFWNQYILIQKPGLSQTKYKVKKVQINIFCSAHLAHRLWFFIAVCWLLTSVLYFLWSKITSLYLRIYLVYVRPALESVQNLNFRFGIQTKYNFDYWSIMRL